MKKSLLFALFAAGIVFFPAKIKTQWHTNGYLALSGPVAVCMKGTWGLPHWLAAPAFWPLAFAETRLAIDSSLVAHSSGWTFETSFFLDDASLPATFITVVDALAGRSLLQLRTERQGLLTAELEDRAGRRIAQLRGEWPVPAGEWLHVALVIDRDTTEGMTIRLYLQGQKLAEALASANWHWPATALLYLGGAPGFLSYSGKLDQVRVSTTARYQGDVYPVGGARFADAFTLGLWNFEEQPAVSPTVVPADAGPALRLHQQPAVSGVRFSHFTARARRAGGIALRWETELEQGLESFAIERRKATATAKFESLGSMPAVGDSQQKLTYNFVDAPDQPGVYYYRLRCRDGDGRVGYTTEIACTQPGVRTTL